MSHHFKHIFGKYKKRMTPLFLDTRPKSIAPFFCVTFVTFVTLYKNNSNKANQGTFWHSQKCYNGKNACNICNKIEVKTGHHLPNLVTDVTNVTRRVTVSKASNYLAANTLASFVTIVTNVTHFLKSGHFTHFGFSRHIFLAVVFSFIFSELYKK